MTVVFQEQEAGKRTHDDGVELSTIELAFFAFELDADGLQFSLRTLRFLGTFLVLRQHGLAHIDAYNLFHI